MNHRILAAALMSALAAPALAQCASFGVTSTGGATIDPGVTDIGNRCDDCVTNVALPFPVTLYGASYSSVSVSSNGNLQFGTSNTGFANACLPQQAILGTSILAQWDDLRTDGAGNGIFTSTTGVAPNRVFNVEWRSTYYSGGGASNFEIRLFEDASRFEIIYGTVDQLGASATVGVQHSSGIHRQYSCNTAVLTPGTKLTFACTNDSVPPAGTGASAPSSVYACGAGEATRLTVNVTSGFNPASTGLSVTANLSSIGGSASQVFFNNGTNGDVTANDSVHTYQITVTGSVTPGNKVIPFTVSDAQGRSSGGAIALLVNPCPILGPDVFVARLTDVGFYGTTGDITAYSVGTDACNMGDVPVQWIAGNTQHPVIAQNFYRLKGGRFEQIGQSWLKHGFSSTNSGTCGTCITPPLGGQQLGVNCSDAYGAGLNGSQGNLGPRSEVNATTGAYSWPFGGATASTNIDKRLQVKTVDIDPALNSGAQFFAETHYITADDARWSIQGAPAINGLNNASFQRITVANTTSAPALTGTITRHMPAIKAWKDADPAVSLVAADYIDTSLGLPGIVARFWVAGRATSNGDGTWHYEYAVHNLNADRCAGGFSIPAGPGVTVSNVGFHGIFTHTGEPYPNSAANPAAWANTLAAYELTWACAPYSGNGNTSNALRWGTMYNFRFDSNTPPTTGNGSIALFKPGALGEIAVAGIPVPGLPPCRADYNSDGSVDGDDVITFFALWDSSDILADITRDGGVDGDDVIDFFQRWDSGC